jgi:hypothetical protein
VVAMGVVAIVVVAGRDDVPGLCLGWFFTGLCRNNLNMTLNL